MFFFKSLLRYKYVKNSNSFDITMNIGIIGNGFVGKATKILECAKIETYMYDIDPDLCDPSGLTLEELVLNCDIIFISVPTPMNKDGSCHLKILESVIKNISKYTELDNKCVVIRSTVPPGTANRLNCYFMPEFLTEKNYKKDFVNNNKWIFGLKNKKQDVVFKEKITFLINMSFLNKKIKNNNIIFLENSEAEMVKLFRNAFLAVKVSFCNEMYEFCDEQNINYENVRKVACFDNRIGESHSYVPGNDGKRGYGGTCFPKDIRNINSEMEKINIKSHIIKSSIYRNEHIDRPEREWKENKGRTVV